MKTIEHWQQKLLEFLSTPPPPVSDEAAYTAYGTQADSLRTTFQEHDIPTTEQHYALSLQNKHKYCFWWVGSRMGDNLTVGHATNAWEAFDKGDNVDHLIELLEKTAMNRLTITVYTPPKQEKTFFSWLRKLIPSS